MLCACVQRPLSFGRTNVLSEEILELCAFTAGHFPAQTDVARKLRASFSRAISVGVARTTSTLNPSPSVTCSSAAARVGVPATSSLALRDPFSPASPPRSLPTSIEIPKTSLSLQNKARMRAQVARVLAGCSEGFARMFAVKGFARICRSRHAEGVNCVSLPIRQLWIRGSFCNLIFAFYLGF